MSDTPRTGAALAATLDDGFDLGPQHRRLVELCRELEAELYTLREQLTQANAAYALVQQDCWNLTEKVIPNLREQLAEARAVPEAALRYLRDTAQTGTPNEQAVARTVMHLLSTTPSPAAQPISGEQP